MLQHYVFYRNNFPSEQLVTDDEANDDETNAQEHESDAE